MRTYRIQRATIRKNESRKGLDSIIDLDYMGAAEYEFGDVPKSLRNIRESIEKYSMVHVTIYKKAITVFCTKEQMFETPEYFNELATGKMYTKMDSYFDRYVKPSEHDTEWFKKHPLETNFWWDIDNDMMFWVTDEKFEAEFETVIQPRA